MRFCNQCGTPLDDSVGFCPNCGAPAVMPGSRNISPQPPQSNPPYYNGGYPGNMGYPGAPVNAERPSTPVNVGSPNYGGNAMAVVSSITGKMRTSSTIWMIIGILQIITGVLTFCLGYGILALCLGIWNVVQSNTKRKNAARFDQNPTGIVNYFEANGTMLVVFLFLNLFLGALFGVIGSIYDLTVRSSALSQRNELLRAEAAFSPRGGYPNGGMY